ncbi:PAS domain S-box-containing protein [Methylomagnum ishizawai]|uniref:histidine kinase n=1 Tax=Methylomagnum ishizawai TaxID=1760988 RepID=A0A1Y6DAS2_9GAMM|nr:PAS domain S-box protein [Methylomagnum ishizawai]SMF97412.1 PAS domain S-box-containing protein [Methylomagnum ishizawai]
MSSQCLGPTPPLPYSVRPGFDFLAGGGETGRLIRALDWSRTPLGPVESWPQSLRTSVSTCLHCPFPILIGWGPELVMLYNDAYRPLLGIQHPGAVGQRGRQCGAGIWDTIGPMLEQALLRGAAGPVDDLLLLVERDGSPEEGYFSFSYSPIHDEDGKIAGVFCPVIDTTAKVVGARRLRTLRDLGALGRSGSGADTCEAVAAVLAANPYDLPFALLYLSDPEHKTLRLAGSAGIAPGGPASPWELPLDGAKGWSVEGLPAGGRLIEPLWALFPGLPTGAWRRPPDQALCLPVVPPGAGRAAAVLIAGLNPHRRPDPDYRQFLGLVAQQFAMVLPVADDPARHTAHRRLQALMKALPVGVSFSDDPSCQHITGNPAVLAQFEVADTDNLSASAPDMEAPGRQVRFFRDGRPVLPEELPLQRAVAENREIPPMELEVWLPSGKRWFALASGAPLRDPVGQVIGGVAVTEDVTERKRAERALAASEERFRAIFEYAALGIAIIDAEGRLIRCNPAYCALLGHTQAELAHRIFLELVHPEDRADNLLGIQRLLAGELPYFEVENRYLRQDGEPVWVRKFVSFLRVPAQEAPHLMTLVTDMTERRRMEDALREGDRRKDEFLAILSHELRNPLAPIRNSLYALGGAGGHSSRTAHALTVMIRQVDHLVRLVDDLMEASRITRGKVELKKQRIALAGVIEQAVETSRPLVESGGHRLDVVLPPDPLHLDADPVRLAQVFTNLLNNAAKYTEPHGRIGIAAERQGNEAVIGVSDTGVGIPEAMLPRVFELFSQVDHGQGRAQGGLGIGLALVRHLVQLHGGRIEARSGGVGRGSEFVVRIPLAEAPPAGFQASADPPAPEFPRRLLVVDDNRDAADSLALLLELLGIEVRVAYDGSAALALLAEFPPDVVLLDLGMPGMDGYEVARRIRGQPGGRDIALFALTGWGQAADRHRTRLGGFDQHLVKPVDFEDLRRLLAEVGTCRGGARDAGP